MVMERKQKEKKLNKNIINQEQKKKRINKKWRIRKKDT